MCNTENDSNCSIEGGDDDSPSECENKYHLDDTPVVPLSTGWFNKSRCLNITIRENGRSVVAMVVDECDSRMRCDEDHDYQPTCKNNIVDVSKAVWEALGVPHEQWRGRNGPYLVRCLMFFNGVACTLLGFYVVVK
ncbi:hypothetical protein AHAS_Ahas13G0281000 [Arachis hypogaea]